MSKNGRAKQLVTWDMIAAKLDVELENAKSFTQPGENAYLLSYFKTMTAYIHRCLLKQQVPSDLYDAVYMRPKVLGEICHHWMDEAVRRGGDTWAKDGIAQVSVHNWLEQIRLEESEAAWKMNSQDEKPNGQQIVRSKNMITMAQKEDGLMVTKLSVALPDGRILIAADKNSNTHPGIEISVVSEDGTSNVILWAEYNTCRPDYSADQQLRVVLWSAGGEEPTINLSYDTGTFEMENKNGVHTTD